MKQKRLKSKKENKGITLIALVITIIVLLILAGISIASLTGENGILSKADEAKRKTEKETAREKVQLAVLGSYGNNGKLDYKELKDNLDKVQGIQNVPTTIESLPLDVNVDGYKVTIWEDGNVTIEDKKEELYTQGLKYAYDMKTIVNTQKEYGAEFDGTCYLQTENIGSSYTGTNSKTLSTWFKTGIVRNEIIGFSSIGIDGNKTTFLCGIKEGYLYFDTGYGNFIRKDVDYVADGRWHNFTVSYHKDESRIKLYLDGKEIYTGTGEINTLDGPLVIGKSCAYPFNGSIASVRLYNRAISDAEVDTLYQEGNNKYSGTAVRDGLDYEYIMKNNQNGVVVDTANAHVINQVGNVNYYEKQKVKLKDISGNGNHILVDEPYLLNSEEKGYIDFSNTNEYYETNSLEADFLSNNSKTLMAWFKTDLVSNELSGFVGIGIDASATGFLCGVRNGYLYFDTGLSHFIRHDTDYVADGQWHHFVANYNKDARTMQLFLDGEKIYEEIGDIDTKPSTLTIGKSFRYLYNGQIRDVRLYNISVEENIIKQIYENEK